MILNRDQVLGYARSAGFTGRSLIVIVAIAQAESGFDTTARNYNTNGTTDRGILQINTIHTWVTQGCADDPACAFRAGYKIASNGSNFTPWTTYLTGAYLAYMPGDDDGPPPHSGGVEAYRQALVPGASLISVFNDCRPSPSDCQYGHQGEDLAAARGTAIYAPEDGEITDTRPSTIGGNVFYFSGDSGVYLYGAHLDRRVQHKDGTRLAAGAVIGYVGNTGDASTTIPHLHYQVRTDDEWDNPVDVLAEWNPVDRGGGGGGGRMASAILYDQPEYEGNDHTLTASAPRAEVKSWFGHSPAHVRSISISPGTIITVYQDINYKGESRRFTTSIEDTLEALPWADARDNGKVVSSIKLESAGGGGGGGSTGAGSFGGIADVVHSILAHTPGFYGIALAVDAAEQFPGYVSVHDNTSDLPFGIDLGVGDTIRSVWITLGANFLPGAVRGITVFIGLFLLMALIWNLVKDPVIEIAGAAI